MKRIYLITGSDPTLIERSAAKIIRGLTKNTDDTYSLEIHKETEDCLPQELIRDVIMSLNTPPFLGDCKTLWMKNITFFADERPQSESKRNHPTTIALTQLANFIETEFPDYATLVVSGPNLDTTKFFYKTCAKYANVERHDKPDLRRQAWRREIESIIQKELRDYGMSISPPSLAYLIEHIGVDTDRVKNEVEKVYCFAGLNPTLEQVKEVCTGSREAVFYAIATAIGERDIDKIYEAITQLFTRTKDPESLALGQLRFLSKHVNELLQAKILTSYSKRTSISPKNPTFDLSGNDQFEYNGVVRKPDWQRRLLQGQAKKYTGQEFVSAVVALSKIDRLMVTSSISKRLLLEFFILNLTRHDVSKRQI